VSARAAHAREDLVAQFSRERGKLMDGKSLEIGWKLDAI
jgi:hypothetical protein